MDTIVEDLNINFVFLTNFNVYKKLCLKFFVLENLINASGTIQIFSSILLIIFETRILKFRKLKKRGPNTNSKILNMIILILKLKVVFYFNY